MTTENDVMMGHFISLEINQILLIFCNFTWAKTHFSISYFYCREASTHLGVDMFFYTMWWEKLMAILEFGRRYFFCWLDVCMCFGEVQSRNMPSIPLKNSKIFKFTMVPVAPCYFAFLESCAGEYRNGLLCFYSIKPTRLITCILPCMGYAIKVWSHVFFSNSY